MRFWSQQAKTEARTIAKNSNKRIAKQEWNNKEKGLHSK